MDKTKLTAVALAVLLAGAASARTRPADDPNHPDPHPHLKVPLPKIRIPGAELFVPTALVAPKIGVFIPTSRLKAAAIGGVQADWVTPWLEGGALSLGFELTWARPTYKGILSDPQLRAADTTVNLGASQLGFALLATYRFGDVFAGLSPYAGGGPALFHHRVASTAFGENALEKESKLGLSLLGGLEMAAGPGAAFFEVQGRLARTSLTMPGFTNLGGFLASAGYRFRM